MWPKKSVLTAFLPWLDSASRAAMSARVRAASDFQAPCRGHSAGSDQAAPLIATRTKKQSVFMLINTRVAEFASYGMAVPRECPLLAELSRRRVTQNDLFR